jgi:hypothetical protein
MPKKGPQVKRKGRPLNRQELEVFSKVLAALCGDYGKKAERWARSHLRECAIY